ncbi:MAG: PilZ domain-containing protein [Candidatus Omnitrophica bacterium]|nr:PilZ domain-containing protein [Candidatus Omnitrophota bacterium]
MDGYEEKRKFPRIVTHIPVKYRKLNDPGSVSGGGSVTKNLSVGGVRFTTPEFISRACRLILELDMPMLTKPIKAISKVAWIRKLSSGGNFEIGSRFLEISKTDKELVSKYVDSLNHYNDSGETENLAESAGSSLVQ